MSNRIDPDIERACGAVKGVIVNGLKPVYRVKQHGDISGTTLRAKELYMYGNGDGKPVRNVARLADLSGAAVRTLEKHVAGWKVESEELARAVNGGKRELVASVTIQVVQWQSERVARLKFEVERLEKLLPTLPEGSDIHANTLKLYTATLKAWEQSSGYAAHADLMATSNKELLKTAARLHGREASDGPREVSGHTFDVQPALPESST